MQDLKNHKKNHTHFKSPPKSPSIFSSVQLFQSSLSKAIAISSLLFITYTVFGETTVIAEIHTNDSLIQLKNPLYRESLALIEARDYKSAVNSLTSFLEENPSSDKAYFFRGKAFHELEALDKASADYNKAIELNPEFYKAHNNLGLIYGRIKKFNLAKKSFTKAINVNSQPKEAFNNRGVAKAATGDTNGAISDFTKSIEIDTKYLEPLLNRSFVLEMQGKLKKACNDWEKASVLGSKDAKTWHIAQCK